uniref:Caspase-1-like n=1 Tax=Diabrotica virgifera virgifera TaxID=50390 RepID=A0A6P7FHH4_DIAVI
MWSFKSKDKNSSKDGTKKRTVSETVVQNNTANNYNVSMRRTIHFMETSHSSQQRTITTSSSSGSITSRWPPSSTNIENTRLGSISDLTLRPIPYAGQSVNLPRMTPNYTSPFTRHNSERLPTKTTNNNVVSKRFILPSSQKVETDARPFQNGSSISSVPRIQPTTVPVPINNTRPITSSDIPKYDTNGPKRGTVVIFNNIKFLNKNDERKGAELDEKNLKTLFRNMGFDVYVHRNQKLNEMKSKLNSYRQSRDVGRGDILIVIVMSHGNNARGSEEIPGGFTKIQTSDDKYLNVDEVLSEFTNDRCAPMKGKPKIFIFQCCRGHREELQIDAVPFTNIVKKHADMLIAFSTVPGFSSIRAPQEGSWYIQSICDVFKQHGKQHHVEDLLKLVDQELSRKHHTFKQTSTYENRGFKQCYLNPRNI